MNFIKKGIIAIMFLAFVGTFANAQTNDFSITATVGVGTPILDNGIGWHIGVNPGFSVSEYFAVEAQVSYFNTKITGSFLSGDTGKAHAVNGLIGPRLYFTPQDAKVRPYINGLIGGLYNREIKERIGGTSTISEFDIGFSGGAFVEIDKFVVGLSYDTPQNLILKVGYSFGK